MKNYSLKEKVDNPFVTNFIIKDDCIEVFIADGKNLIIPKTQENIIKLRNIMTKQVFNARELLPEKKRRRLGFTVLTIASVTGLVIVNNTNISNEISNYIMNAGLGGATLLSGVGIMVNNSFIKDINKLKLFVRYSKTLNEEIITNPYVYANIRQKDKALVESWIGQNEEPLVIENLDQISYESVKTMVNNITISDKLGINYGEPKTLRKTR